MTYQHLPLSSQMPEVWPSVTQLAEQAHCPRVHLKPALIPQMRLKTKMLTIEIFILEETM